MGKSYQVIADKEILLSFIEKLGIKTFTKCSDSKMIKHFIFTAFRTKKFSEELRSKLKQCGIARSFSEVSLYKTVNILDKQSVVRKVHEMEVPYDALTYITPFNENICLPQDAMITYICVNPTNLLNMILTVCKDVLGYLGEIIKCRLKPESLNKLLSVLESRSKYMTSINKWWIDIDIDLNDKKEIAENIIEQASNEFNVHGFLINTSGGFHFLIERSTLHCDPNKIANFITESCCKEYIDFNEVVYKSDSCAVPLPGTLQYNKHIVTYKQI